MRPVERHQLKKTLGRLAAGVALAALPALASASVPQFCAHCQALPSSGMRNLMPSSHLQNVSALFSQRGGNIAGLFRQRDAIRGGFPSHLNQSSALGLHTGGLQIRGRQVGRDTLPQANLPDFSQVLAYHLQALQTGHVAPGAGIAMAAPAAPMPPAVPVGVIPGLGDEVLPPR